MEEKLNSFRVCRSESASNDTVTFSSRVMNLCKLLRPELGLAMVFIPEVMFRNVAGFL